jgi:hypothetical protein
MSWALGLTIATILLPLVFGQLAVLTGLFKEDPDSVVRSPLPHAIDSATTDFVEAASPEPFE